MDHMERIGRVSAGLAAIALAVVAAGCVAGDETTASLADESEAGSLPSITRPAETETSGSPTSADGGDSATGSSAASGTSTTEPPAPLQGLAAELVADGFDQPILVTGAPGTSALFVVEREGVIRIVEDGVVADEPFLDLRQELLSSSIEQGLLGLAFHPDYASTGRFFAYWTDRDGDSRLGEFHAPEPTVADAASLQVLLEVDQPAERHNAGMLQFGPDGLLYVALGDGGSGGGTAQDTSNLLGSVLRLDVDSAEPYAIPAGNPFGDEIWVYGLRNPWRFSIDPLDEVMYIGDVGQDGFEEINVVGLDGAGTNFGWSEMEGDRCFQSGCDQDGLTIPALQYTHDEGCSVTGGWVYRGRAIPEFNGHYFYADWCKSFVRSFRLANGRVVDQFDWTTELAELDQVTSFGLDNDAELYAVNWQGQLFKIVPLR